jgi:hypothetical protein
LKSKFVYEQIEDILKPKSRKDIIKDFENLSIEQKEDLLLNSHYRDDLLNYIEDEILSEEESDKIWDNIIDFYIENVNDENLYDEGGNLNEIDKEYVKNHMSEIFLNEIFVEFLTEKQLNKTIKKLWPEYIKEESIKDILKPKDTNKIIEDFLDENIWGNVGDIEKMLLHLNEYISIKDNKKKIEETLLETLKGFIEYFLDTWEDNHEE